MESGLTPCQARTLERSTNSLYFELILSLNALTTKVEEELICQNYRFTEVEYLATSSS